MKKVFKTLSGLTVLSTILIGISSPAQAIAVGKPDYYKIDCVADTKTYYTYKDYNWFEEVFLGKKDGYVAYYWVRYYC